MLAGDDIRRRGVVHGHDPEALQPNGVDLSLDAVWRFEGAGTLGISERVNLSSYDTAKSIPCGRDALFISISEARCLQSELEAREGTQEVQDQLWRDDQTLPVSGCDSIRLVLPVTHYIRALVATRAQTPCTRP